MKYLFILYAIVGVLTFGWAFVDIEAETRAECVDRPFCFPKEVATYGGLLSGVLGGVCRKFDIPLLAARGYPSVSIVREMALEYFGDAINNGQDVTVLHLGDHDPSGKDMTRDLQERFELFLGDDGGSFNLERIALNMKQIEEVNPPPNPAKTTDSRFQAYKAEFGEESWELDALEPAYIVDLVTRKVEDFIDPDAWAEKADEVEAIRTKLQRTAARFDTSK